MQFHEKLRALRKGKNWTMEDLARESGVSYRMIQKYESNLAFPRVTAAEKLADALGVRIDDLMCRQEKEIAQAEEDSYENIQKKLFNNIDEIRIAMAGGKIRKEDRDIIMKNIMEAYVMAEQKENENKK